MMAEMQAQQPVELLLESVEIDVENDPDVIEVVNELGKVYITTSEIREVCLARRHRMEEQGKFISDEQFHRIVLETMSNTFPRLSEAGGVLGAIGGAISGARKAVGTAVATAGKKLGPIAKAAWKSMKEFGEEAWKGIQKVAGDSWEAIQAKAQDWGPKIGKAWTDAKKMIQGGADAIKEKWAEYSPKLQKVANDLKGKAGDLAKNFKALKSKAPKAIDKAAATSGLNKNDITKIKALLADPGALNDAISAGASGSKDANPQALQFAMMMPFIMMMMTMMQAQGAGTQQLAAGRIISKSRVQAIIDEEVRKQLGVIKG
jgi:hypothetical protein